MSSPLTRPFSVPLALTAVLVAVPSPAWGHPTRQEPEAQPAPRLALDDVRTAGRVIGLEFTDDELALMLPEVSDALAEYDALRAPSLANGVLPAVTFSPFLPGMERHTPRETTPRGLVAAGGVPDRPEHLEDVALYSIAELGELIRHQRMTCTELTRMYLARLRRLDAGLHCVITYTEERALAQAMKLDAELVQGRYRGPLHGIPWGVKDLFSVAGYRTTWGARPFEAQVIDETAAVVERLDEAGAVLIAKLSVGALAMGDVWFAERTRSPWNPERGSSGSSAGSAAATAAGGVAFALGTETLGSLVSPSVVCATCTLRPTFGRVSRHGAMALTWTMDKVGPITRSARDAALVFAAIEGRDPRDPFSRDPAAPPARSTSEPGNPDGATAKPGNGPRLRIGVVAGAFERSAELEGVLDELRALGHTLVDVALPSYPVGPMLITLSAEAATAFDELTRSGRDELLVRQSRDAWPNTFRVARLIPAVEYLRAQRLRTGLMLDLHAALAEVDVLVHAPFAAGLLRMTNLTGHPTVVAPYVGASGPRRDGSPRSVCFTGQLDGDELLLECVAAWQAAHPEHTLQPALEWLAGPGADEGAAAPAEPAGDGGR